MTRASFVSFPHFVKLFDETFRVLSEITTSTYLCCVLAVPSRSPAVRGASNSIQITVEPCDGSHGDGPVHARPSWCVRTEDAGARRGRRSSVFPRAPHCHWEKSPRPHLSYGIQSHHMVRAKSPPQVVAWHLSLGNTGLGATLSSPRPSMKQWCLQSPMHAFSKSWSPSSPSMWPSPVGRCYSSSIGAASVPV